MAVRRRENPIDTPTPPVADPGAFARYWETLVRCHGPLLGADQVQRDRQTVGDRLRFARQDYVFMAVPGEGGKLDQLPLVPYPVGGTMRVRASHGIRVAAADPKAPAG